MSFFLRVFAILLLTSSLAVADEEPGELVSVFAEGTANIQRGNYVSARDSAFDNALRNALYNALRTLISQDDINRKEEFIDERIYSRGLDFVQSYRFVSEGIGRGDAGLPSVYQVNMEFTLFVTFIRKELSLEGVEISGGQNPKVVLIVNEHTLGMTQGVGSLVLPSATEDNIKQGISTGYYIVGRQEVHKLGNDNKVLMAMDGDKAAVKWLASEFDADYLILGSAQSKDHSSNSSAYVEGTVEVTIYDGATGTVLRKEKSSERVDGMGGASGFKSMRLASDKLKRKLASFLGNPGKR